MPVTFQPNMPDTCDDCGAPAELLTLGGDFLCRPYNLQRWLLSELGKAENAGRAAAVAVELGYADIAAQYASAAAKFAKLYLATVYLAENGAQFAPCNGGAA